MVRFLYRLAFLVLLLGATSQAAVIGGVALPVNRGEMELQGAGLLRKGLFFKIYVGALYLEETADPAQCLTERSKRIDIHYFHKTPSGLMARVAQKTLKKNLTQEQYDELLPKIKELHRAYMNGQKGSFASIIYEPGEGLTYSYDNDEIITIDCDEFANAYFTIWLGEKPSSRTVKRAMLGNLGGF